LISSYRNTPSPSAVQPDGGFVLRYFDVLLIVVAAPILILMGVPAAGYAAGGGAWLVLRAVGVGLDRYLAGMSDPRREISLRLGYLMARVFLLALAVILVRRDEGRDAALTALVIIVVAFTIQLAVSFIHRPRRAR
jgi:hypothetical protein